MRPALDLVENAADVLPDNAQKNQLNAAENGQEDDDRGPSRRHGHVKEILNQGDRPHDEPEGGKEKSDDNRSFQRFLAERYDSEKTELNQTSERVFAPAGRASFDIESDR